MLKTTKLFNIIHKGHQVGLNVTIRRKSSSKVITPVQLASTTYEKEASDQNVAPLIVMHGLFGSKGNWSSLCKAYQQKTDPPRKIIALDLRNHGDSPHTEKHGYPLLAEDLKYFMDSSEIGKAVVMGHSMGGRAAMLFALKYPEYVHKLIVADISPVGTSPSLRSMPPLFGILRRVQMPQDVAMSKARSMIDEQLAQSIDDPGLRQFLLTNLVQNPDKTYKWRLNIPVIEKYFYKLSRFPRIHDLQYHGQTLFVAGGNSDYVKQEDFSAIQVLFPKAELTFIEGAGHWLHAEKSTEYLNITLEFINRS